MPPKPQTSSRLAPSSPLTPNPSFTSHHHHINRSRMTMRREHLRVSGWGIRIVTCFPIINRSRDLQQLCHQLQRRPRRLRVSQESVEPLQPLSIFSPLTPLLWKRFSTYHNIIMFYAFQWSLDYSNISLKWLWTFVFL